MTRAGATGAVLPLPATTRVGVDQLAIGAVRRSVEDFGERYLRRVYTADELAVCVDADGAPDVARLAGRFAVKEATLKALGVPDGVRLTDVGTVSEPSGRPGLALTGEAQRRSTSLGVRAAAVSISHEGPYAVAVVVLELEPGSACG